MRKRYVVHQPHSDSHTSHKTLSAARSKAQSRANKTGREYDIDLAEGDMEWRHVEGVYPKSSNPARRRRTRKNAPRRKNAGSKAKLLKNFTGVVRLNADKTVSIVGTGKKVNPARKRAKRRARR
jgi:hypothetical protein